MEPRKRRGKKTRKDRVTKHINLKSFDMKVLLHQPNKNIDFAAEYYQNQDLPDKIADICQENNVSIKIAIST